MNDIILSPIAYVQNSRKTVQDDNWATIKSEIILADYIPSEALDGIEAFSHLEIIFYMNQVSEAKAIARSRHPRNNLNLPKLGTYAQRNKSRPNKLGLTTACLLKKEDRKLIVSHLDAIDNTPILDIKPVMKAFEPKGEIIEPSWVKEIMKVYW